MALSRNIYDYPTAPDRTVVSPELPDSGGRPRAVETPCARA